MVYSFFSISGVKPQQQLQLLRYNTLGQRVALLQLPLSHSFSVSLSLSSSQTLCLSIILSHIFSLCFTLSQFEYTHSYLSFSLSLIHTISVREHAFLSLSFSLSLSHTLTATRSQCEQSVKSVCLDWPDIAKQRTVCEEIFYVWKFCGSTKICFIHRKTFSTGRGKGRLLLQRSEFETHWSQQFSH